MFKEIKESMHAMTKKLGDWEKDPNGPSKNEETRSGGKYVT